MRPNKTDEYMAKFCVEVGHKEQELGWIIEYMFTGKNNDEHRGRSGNNKGNQKSEELIQTNWKELRENADRSDDKIGKQMGRGAARLAN